MAKLNCAKDGHYYILAGQSRGTWQVSDKGLRVLERHGIRLPHRGDRAVEVGWLWRYLWDNELLFKHGIPYNAHDRYDDGAGDDESLNGLPLSLRLQGDLTQWWSLAIALTAIPEEVLAEVRQRKVRAFAVSSDQARKVLISPIQFNSTVLVTPQSKPYWISWFNNTSNQIWPDTPCFFAGLNDTPLGNVFAESQEKNWRRYLPGSTVPFRGTLYWLARDGCLPGWPAEAQQWGMARNGWRLWRLMTSAEKPVSWQAIAGWLSKRSLTLASHTQHLRLITPPLAITQEGWSLVSRDQPLIIGCTPPGYVTPGVRSQLQLTVFRVDGGRDIAIDVAPGLQHDAASDEPWFARWMRPQPGDYRIQALGGATVEPLLVRVLSDASVYQTTPTWLQGLACHLTAGDHSEMLTAFAESKHPRVTTFSDAELPHLQWELQPEGLPVWVSWHPDTESTDDYSLHTIKMESGEELTRWWHDTIWHDCASARGVQLTIEGDSFGRIECAIGLPLRNESADKCIPTAKQRAELVWLAQLSLAPSKQPRVPLPADLRLSLERQHVSALQASNATTIAAAVSLLRAQQAIPAWIVPRLRVLVAAEPAQARTSSARTTSFEATLAQ